MCTSIHIPNVRVTLMYLDQIRTSVPFHGGEGVKIENKQYCYFIVI